MKKSVGILLIVGIVSLSILIGFLFPFHNYKGEVVLTPAQVLDMGAYSIKAYCCVGSNYKCLVEYSSLDEKDFLTPISKGESFSVVGLFLLVFITIPALNTKWSETYFK